MAASGALLGGTSLLFSMQLPVQADGPTLFQKIVEISDRLERVEDALGVEDLENERLLKLIQKARVDFPDNLMAKHFDFDYYKSLSPGLRKRLLRCCKSGAENMDSGMGMYAMHPEDYDLFKPYMDKVIRAYHKISGNVHHVTNWELSTKADKLPAGGKLDLTKLGLGPTSMRVRVGRNLADYPLPGAMTKEDRLRMEQQMLKAFKKLISDPAYGGQYYSLTPGLPESISDAKYKELVNSHLMFKDMAADSYLASAGIASDWPHGRGCYVSADKGFIVWVGEEDHLRIMCMKRGTFLNDVFDRLKGACDVVEKNAGTFAHSKDYGYVTSCPTNLGTGMRASLHIQLPNLTADGTESKAKAVCKPLGLSVRGKGGEHTPIGADGTVDISPSARLMIEEADIVVALYEGIKRLLAEEKKCPPRTK
eukprot:CAMPEP_0114245388 /NCGR_PEP_ID=MMETSP0058-20121206/11867_1 /TAXON_ID=36894 /ORGANISM="Pyramimonas parkeae, CCMP726" /LENGTH=422 /DNA_ID=CAMNT_0001358433 /DNA_START=151 /DNA_END=1419 /DNA_ORIENTATION=-